jgi:hypothetical protein
MPPKNEGKRPNTSEVIEVSIFVGKIPVFHNYNFQNVITRKIIIRISKFLGEPLPIISTFPFHPL